MLSELFTPFLPSTINFPEDDATIRPFLNEQLSLYADLINQKKIGIITPSENFNGELWGYLTTSKQRNGYQIISYIASYPNASSLSIPLPITTVEPQFVVTQVYGSASKPNSSIGAGDGNYFSYMSQGDSRVSFTMSDTQIVVTTTTNLSAYSGFIVINYLRNGT